MSDDERKDMSASPAYVLAQLSRAFVNSQRLETAEARKQSSDKLADWMRVFEGMLKGDLKIGSRQPSKAPVWATLKVLKGGFSTGDLLAGGPLQAHEVALLSRLFQSGNRGTSSPVVDVQSSPNKNPDRTLLNSFYLTERGFDELNEMMQSGAYRVTVPEEGALLVVAWLVKNGHADKAQKITDKIAPYISNLRFYPVPAAEAQTQDDNTVYMQPVSETIANLSNVRSRSDLAAFKEAVTVWSPLTDRAFELMNETVVDSWPCQKYPDGWGERAKQFLKEYGELSRKHTNCKKHKTPGESFDVLREGIHRSVHNQKSMTGREIGRIRKVLLGIEAKRGKPDSQRCIDLRNAQQSLALRPTSLEFAKLLIKRLNRLPADSALSTVDDLLEDVSAREAAEFGLPAQSQLPESFRLKLLRSVRAPIDELVRSNVISSAEVLAKVVPQLSSKVRAASIEDPCLQGIYAQIYRAFRMRRSLLLFNLESQVKLEELPWIDAIGAFRTVSNTDSDANATFRDLCKLLMTHFPHQIIPNKMLQELRALAKAAGLDLPLTDELAADIFMGEFSEKFLSSAKIAANLLKGTLYERYYGLEYDLVLRINDLMPSRYGPPTSKQFAAMCSQLAGSSNAANGGFSVAANGIVIEQQQILTTHNLAVLFEALNLTDAFGECLPELPRACFRWICKRLGQKNSSFHARLIQIKNAAYAWRQMVFFLSLLSLSEQQSFFVWAQDYLDTKCKSSKEMVEPILYGLDGIVDPSATPWQITAGVSNPMRFLGWSTGGHFLLEKEKVR